MPSALAASSVTFGYDHQSDQADSKMNMVYGGYPDLASVRAHDDTDSGYLGLQSIFLKRLAVIGQVREDATTVAGSAFTWRLGGVLGLPEIASHLKASYGTSFRAPALNDRYGIDSYGYVGNPNLRPERSEGYEAGFVTELPLAAQQAASIGVTYFSNRIRDLIQKSGTRQIIRRPRRSISPAPALRAIETTLTYRAAPWVQADLTHTYTDARDLDAHTQLLRRPYNQGSADLRHRARPRRGAGTGGALCRQFSGCPDGRCRNVAHPVHRPLGKRRDLQPERHLAGDQAGRVVRVGQEPRQFALRAGRTVIRRRARRSWPARG